MITQVHLIHSLGYGIYDYTAITDLTYKSVNH